MYNKSATIIGGGITGCSVAYYLTKNGYNVELIEQDDIAAHASGRAFGILPADLQQHCSEAVEFAIEAKQLHRSLSEYFTENGSSYHFIDKISMFLTYTSSDLDFYRRYLNEQNSLEARILSADEALKEEPRLATNICGAMLEFGGIEIDPAALCNAMKDYVLSHGGKVTFGKVTDLKYRDGKVIAIKIEEHEKPVTNLIVAAGYWSGEILALVDARIDLIPVRGQIVRMKSEQPPLKHAIWWDEDYVASKPNGQIYVGATFEIGKSSEKTTDFQINRIIASVNGILPYLKDAKFLLATACLRPYTSDGIPVVGKLPQFDNMYIASGTGRNGILFGPLVGKLLAQEIISGNLPDNKDYKRFTPNRFFD